MKFKSLISPSIRYQLGKGDPFQTRLCDWIENDYQHKTEYDIALIGIPLSKSSISFSGAHLHPESFRKLLGNFTTYHWDEDIDLASLKAVDLGDVPMHVTDILQCHENISQASHEVFTQIPQTIHVFIGGDHSITYPILKGRKEANKQRIGVVHFDAHLDVRDTQYGGPSNGTPMRSLIEDGIIKGEDFFTIGLRNFANSKAYRTYAEEKGMNLYSSADAKKQGMSSIIEHALKELNKKCDVIYVTCDIDVMDQIFVPGVPAMGPSGVHPNDILESMKVLGQHPKVIGLDLVCVDPTKDLRDMTSRISLHVFLHFAIGIAKRKK